MISLQICEEKKRILSKMKDEVANCYKCSQLCETRYQTVFADGNPMSRVMLVGEAPGEEENKLGKPFVGRAGKLLDNILKALSWDRNDVYIANIIKCRPSQNRVPKPEEISNCISFLERQIEVVNPDYIICLGSVASNTLIGKPVSEARGQWFKYKNHKVICTWHPAYVLRNQDAKKDVWEDLKLLVKDMRESLSN